MSTARSCQRDKESSTESDICTVRCCLYESHKSLYMCVYISDKINVFRYVLFLAHLSRSLLGELIVYPCSGFRPSSVISNMNISATCGLITMKFYQKHHWDGGKAALGFGPDRIQTLVSMATNSSHRVIMEKTVLPLFLCCFLSNPFYSCR